MLAMSQLAWLANARFAVPKVGRQPPCRCGGGSSAASWDAREPETQGPFQMEKGKRPWDIPGPGREAGVVPAGPTLEGSCALRVPTSAGSRAGHISLPILLPAQRSHTGLPGAVRAVME